MEVLPTLVLLHIVFQAAGSAELLHPPELSIQPQYPEYFEGERLDLICSAFSNKTVGYRFFGQDGQQIVKMAVYPYQKGKLGFQAQMNHSGKYSCNYWMEEDGTEVTSARSDPISIQVKEAPAAPSLSLNPELPEYSLGDKVSLVCTAPQEIGEVTEFQYSRDRWGVSSVASRSSNRTYNMRIDELKDFGPFRCAYILNLSGRTVRSTKSNSVIIARPVGARWGRMLAVGGSFFTINSLIFLISHWCF